MTPAAFSPIATVKKKEFIQRNKRRSICSHRLSSARHDHLLRFICLQSLTGRESVCLCACVCERERSRVHNRGRNGTITASSACVLQCACVCVRMCVPIKCNHGAPVLIYASGQAGGRRVSHAGVRTWSEGKGGQLILSGS